jgi:uncharacterized membrane protein
VSRKLSVEGWSWVGALLGTGLALVFGDLSFWKFLAFLIVIGVVFALAFSVRTPRGLLTIAVMVLLGLAYGAIIGLVLVWLPSPALLLAATAIVVFEALRWSRRRRRADR